MMPWDDIKTPDSSQSYSARLANPGNPFDFYWGKNFRGNFVFRYLGNFNSEAFHDAPQMIGIGVESGQEGKRSHLTLTLEDAADEGIFFLLCKSLIQATDGIPKGEDAAAARVVMNHLLRWQKILQKKKDSGSLSLNEQTGLFGELLMLENFFLKNLDPRRAVEAWTGPLDDEQDFSYGQTLLEVKTSRASRDRKIRISSVDQLDTVSGRIILSFIGVAQADRESEGALSLNQLVSQVYDHFSDDLLAQEIFATRLAMKSYENLPVYDTNFFLPVSVQFFTVEGSFPRISAADIPSGVTDLSYSILVSSCDPWLITEQDAIERMFGANEQH